MDRRDYYKILGVSSAATEQEIKRAYRELARRYHPDVNPDDSEAENRFKEINEAYAVLNDAEKRAKYDRFGASWQQGGRAASDWRGSPASSPYRRSPRTENGGGSGIFSDVFNAIFGDTRGRAEPDKTPIRGFDVDVQVRISLEEAYTGTTCTIDQEVTGRSFSATIPPGARTGTKVRFAGQGKRGFAGGERGDLYVVVTVDEHPIFDRTGDDLHVELKIDLYTAVLGGEARVPAFSGDVLLKIPPGTQSGKKIRLLAKGMPRLKNPNEYGDLFVKPLIQIPTNLSDTELELYRHLRRLRQS